MPLIEEIKKGESATLEFKESRPKDSLKFTKTVVAFTKLDAGEIRRIKMSAFATGARTRGLV